MRDRQSSRLALLRWSPFSYSGKGPVIARCNGHDDILATDQTIENDPGPLNPVPGSIENVKI